MATVSAVAFLWACSLGLVSAPADTLLVEEFRFGAFQNASRIVVRPSGEIIVTDAGQNRIFSFDSPGQEPRSAGGFGWLPGSFDSPNGVASDGVTYYVSDYGNHRVQRLDRRLVPISALVTRDSSLQEARFGYPAGVALTAFGDLLVVDGENRRVMKFSGASQFDASFGASSSSRMRLGDPVDVAVSPSDIIVVADRGRLLFLDVFGNELRTARHPWLDSVRGVGTGTGSVLAATEEGILWFASDGSSMKEMPWSAVVLSGGAEPVRDIAVHGDRIYLLTPTAVVCCTLHGP
jgi:hypothetical protein